MRKLFRLLYVLVWSFGVVSSFAAAKVIMLAAPKGSNPAGSYARVQKGTDYSKGVAAWKAQNHLTTTTNQRLVREKAGVGGGFGRPGYKNGTMDTVPYFNSWFITGGRNSVYTYSMVGKSPKAGGTTLIENRILPLFIALLDERGNVLYSFDPTGSFLCGAGSDVNLTVQSPLYDASTRAGCRSVRGRTVAPARWSSRGGSGRRPRRAGSPARRRRTARRGGRGRSRPERLGVPD